MTSSTQSAQAKIATSDYATVLRQSFDGAYQRDQDTAWTEDLDLRSIPSLLIDHLKPTINFGNYLDIGCGRGDDVVAMAQHFECTVGVDLFVHPCWESQRQTCPNVEFNGTTFVDFRSERQFDLITDIGCFHHQEEATDDRYFAAVQEFLTPTGVYAVALYEADPGCSRVEVAPDGRLHRYFSDDHAKKLLRDAGFVDIELIAYGEDSAQGEAKRLVLARNARSLAAADSNRR